MKIFLTGGTGLLGRAFVKILTERGISFVAPDSSNLDLLDTDAVDNFIKTEKPDQIIHCAAYTAVDLAETERKKCWDLNVSVLENLLIYNLPIVHFSTDYVFNTDQKPVLIDHERDPLNYYGETKAAAEERLENYTGTWHNVRTTWLYGPDGEGFPAKIKKKAESGEPLTVVDDQFGRKTLSTDLAEFVLGDLSPGSKLPSEPGLNLSLGHHHYQSPGPVHSWYDWAREITDTEIIPISAESLNLAARRPKNSVLV